jgi:hypothetical protein
VYGTLVKGFLYQNKLAPVAELDGANNVVSRFVYGSRRCAGLHDQGRHDLPVNWIDVDGLAPAAASGGDSGSSSGGLSFRFIGPGIETGKQSITPFDEEELNTDKDGPTTFSTKVKRGLVRAFGFYWKYEPPPKIPCKNGSPTRKKVRYFQLRAVKEAYLTPNKNRVPGGAGVAGSSSGAQADLQPRADHRARADLRPRVGRAW